MTISIHSYKFSMEETARYATLADEAMQDGDTVVLNGHGCGLRVMNKALHVKQGSLLGADREPIIYYKGTVPIKTIVLMGKSGMISLEALHWCKEQNISIVMLDGIGNLFYSLSPEGESNAKLRRLQYEANYTGMSGYIAREVVKRKTLAQIATLQDFPWLQDKGETVPILMSGNINAVLYDCDRNKMRGLIREILEDSLHDLSGMKDIASMMALEARNANYYWGVYVGIPLHWQHKDEKLVPPHWKVIVERPSTLSGVSPRRAICPFHAALNYIYGVAEHLLLCAIRAAGLDPACAFLHADHRYRDSLLYDLIEEHRAEIDKKVLEFFERTTLQRGDITMLPMGQIMLNKELSRYMIISCLPDPRKLGDTVTWLIKTLTGKHPNWMSRSGL